MEYLPLSPAEEKFLSEAVDALRTATAGMAGQAGEPPAERCWWDSDPVEVTEVVSDHGSVGQDETLLTVSSSHSAFLMSRMTLFQNERVSSLVLVESGRPPLAVRFRPYRQKRALRFLVGEPGRRGSVWRLWTGTKGDDVYIADRHSSQWAKFSLHASGDWRLAWITEDRDEVQFWSDQGHAPQGRVISRWEAPPSGPVGWTHAMSVYTTADDVVTVPDDNQVDKSPVQVPAPPKGWMVELAVYLVEPDAGMFDMSHCLEPPGAKASIVGGYLLPGNRTVIVWAFTRPVPPGMGGVLAEHRDAVRRNQSMTGWNLHPSSNPRGQAILMPSEDDPVLRLWDLALA